MELTEKTLSSQLIFDGKILKVYFDDIELPDGALLIAVDRREYGEAEVVTHDTVLYPGDEAVIAADHDVIEDVQEVFANL